jgi:hypothetical protein
VSELADLSDREIAARALYRERPFRTAMTGAVMDPMIQEVRVFDFDAAPAFYQSECYELADAILADLAIAGRREQRPLPRQLRSVG